MMAGNRIRAFVGLALVASLIGLLWRLERAPQLKRPSEADVILRANTNSTRSRPTSIEPRVPPPLSVSTDFMRYELRSEQRHWGNLSLLPGFWGYEPRVELPDVAPRELVLQRLGGEFEALLSPLAAVRWASDWSEFLHRWVDPRLTQPAGLGLFNPNVTYAGLKLLPVPKGVDFGLGLKYRWSF